MIYSDKFSSVKQDESAAMVTTHLAEEESDEDRHPQHPVDAQICHAADAVPTATVSTGTCVHYNLVSSGSFQIPSTSHHCDVPVVSSVHSNAPSSFNLSVFNKLPRPVERLLRELPVMDGL
jgi:hypothetical protein